MKGLNDAYVESIIKKSKDGKLPPGRRRQSSTKQYVNRLKKAYAEKGASAFGHGNKGKAKYEGFNFRHFLEKLNEEEGISITYKPLHRILTAAGFKSPKM